jgi:hypothetical protein
MLCHFLQEERASRDFRVLEIVSRRAADIMKDTLTYHFPTFPPARDYLTFELTGDTKTDKIKLDYARLRIREIEQTEDQIHGVNFHFGDSAKYGSLVKALDILFSENALTSIHAERDIWYIGPHPQDELKVITPAVMCGTSYYNKRINMDEETTGECRTLWLMISPYWPIAIFFIALVLCAVLFMLHRRPAPLKFVRVFAEARGRQ